MHFLKWLYPGMRFKRWLLLFAVGLFMVSLGLALVFNYKYLDHIEEAIFRIVYTWRGSYDYTATALVGALIVIVGLAVMALATHYVVRSIIMVLLPQDSSLVDLIYEKRMLGKGPAVTVIGGGHGLSVLLRGIKEATTNVTAVVTVADDGGSSGRLREELGIIPPGDMRNCLVALADTEPLMESLFQYRFDTGSELAGHSFGNLFIAAMSEVMGGDMEKALQESSKVLAVKGRVLPASAEHIRLDAVMNDGSIVQGESNIPNAKKKIKRVRLFPEHVAPVKSVLEAIKNADAIILGPGSLYTSIIPNLLVDGVADALRETKAVKIYICNVLTQPGETDGYTASMHVKAIFDHAGDGVIDYVLVNSAKLSDERRESCAEVNAYPVEVDKDALRKLGVGIAEADLVCWQDTVHHDPKKLTDNVMKMVYELKSGMEYADYYADSRMD